MSGDIPDPAAYLDELQNYAQSVAIGKLADESPVMFQLLNSLRQEAQDASVRALESDRKLKEACGQGAILWGKYLDQCYWSSGQRMLNDCHKWKAEEDYRRWREWHPVRYRLIRLIRGGGR